MASTSVTWKSAVALLKVTARLDLTLGVDLSIGRPENESLNSNWYMLLLL